MDVASIFKRKAVAKETSEQAAWKTYRDILSRMDSPHQGDDDAMEDVIETLQLSKEQIEKDIAAIKKAATLKITASHDPHQLNAAWTNARTACEEFQRQVQKKEHELFMVKVNAEAAKHTAQNARDDFRKLVAATPWLFLEDIPGILAENPSAIPYLNAVELVKRFPTKFNLNVQFCGQYESSINGIDPKTNQHVKNYQLMAI